MTFMMMIMISIDIVLLNNITITKIQLFNKINTKIKTKIIRLLIIIYRINNKIIKLPIKTKIRIVKRKK